MGGAIRSGEEFEGGYPPGSLPEQSPPLPREDTHFDPSACVDAGVSSLTVRVVSEEQGLGGNRIGYRA